MKRTAEIRLHQLNPVIGDVKENTEKILTALRAAEEAGIDLLILPELCVCGYPSLDLLERSAFINTIEKANKRIVESTTQTALIFGSVSKNRSGEGRSCYNAALMSQNGQEIAEIHKTLLPTYDVFDEDRYFEPNGVFECVEWNGSMLGITICEDIWGNNNSNRYHTYALNPVQELIGQGADVIINVSASPFTDTKSEDRERMLKLCVEDNEQPVFYVNQAGANTELISDGDSMVLNKNAEIIARAPLFEEAFVDVAWGAENKLKAKAENSVSVLPARMARIFEALRQGLKEYVTKTAVTSNVLLGLSGGIDSSLVACIAAEAVGAKNVMGIAMPSDFSSAGSLTDAEKLAKNLGIAFHQLPIKSLYDEYLSVLAPLFKDSDFGVAEENLQSRARGMLLMAISNKFNRFVLNTGNKSELATGYCTLYGDMNGAVAVISDLYKTEVFELAQWLNKSYYKKEVIPQEVIEKPPSAELRPEQKDSDRLPSYDKLDTIVKLYIEDQLSISAIERRGINRSTVEQVVQLINQSEYKRYQAPPGLKIHAKAFGLGRRWPLVKQWM